MTKRKATNEKDISAPKNRGGRPRTRKIAPKPAAKARHEIFALEYLKDRVGRQAAIRAGYDPQYATVIASQLLRREDVQGLLKAKLAELEKSALLVADEVARKYLAMATADVSDIIRHERCCCRYCWGKGFRYQRTVSEMEQAVRDFQLLLAEHKKRLQKAIDAGATDKKAVDDVLGIAGIGIFDAAGGTGYDPRRDPNDKCPECFGEGVGRVVLADMRDLPPSARLIYAGVKQTKDSIEVKLRDQDGAMEKYARHIGMFPNRLSLANPKNPGDPSQDTEMRTVVIISPKRDYEPPKEG
ncbi:MAG TPA: terminase small subunit [Gaiellaceae bacterium]|nr:terminase small subunit [Gaiellaceae bacterium]